MRYFDVSQNIIGQKEDCNDARSIIHRLVFN